MRSRPQRFVVVRSVLAGSLAFFAADGLVAQPDIGVGDVTCLGQEQLQFVPAFLNKTAQPDVVAPGDLFAYFVGIGVNQDFEIDFDENATIAQELRDQLPPEALFQSLDAVLEDLGCTPPAVGSSGQIECSFPGAGTDEFMAYTVQADPAASPGIVFNDVFLSIATSNATVLANGSPFYTGPLNCTARVAAPVEIVGGAAAPEIPTMSELGLAALAILTALAGLVFLLRRG